jgi:hypothetical protein
LKKPAEPQAMRIPITLAFALFPDYCAMKEAESG